MAVFQHLRQELHRVPAVAVWIGVALTGVLVYLAWRNSGGSAAQPSAAGTGATVPGSVVAGITVGGTDGSINTTPGTPGLTFAQWVYQHLLERQGRLHIPLGTDMANIARDPQLDASQKNALEELFGGGPSRRPTIAIPNLPNNGSIPTNVVTSAVGAIPPHLIAREPGAPSVMFKV